jgi:hypothetical protein
MVYSLMETMWLLLISDSPPRERGLSDLGRAAGWTSYLKREENMAIIACSTNRSTVML